MTGETSPEENTAALDTDRSDQGAEDLSTEPLVLPIPDLCLVVLIGASGAGKSTFASANFAETEIISSDRARGMISDDENDQSVTGRAFELVNHWASHRLALGKLTVIDATNVQAHARKPLVKLAKDHDVVPVAIIVDTPPEVCHERNRSRTDRNFGSHVIKRQRNQLKKSLRQLKKEGFRYIHHLEGLEAVDGATIERQPRWTDLRDRTGPFDIIGDIHGCGDELIDLLDRLGYRFDGSGTPGEPDGPVAHHPEGRTAVFVGDLVDRGPKVVETLRVVMSMVEAGSALCVAGNHEQKLLRALRGRAVQQTHGLPESLEQLQRCDQEFVSTVETFLDGLLSHYLLDGGNLVVAHAGLPEKFHNRSSGRVRSFCLYGETTGETDEFGMPVRYRWAEDYRGDAAVVYGHTPVPSAEWLNNTICLDTGCVFGGSLTALRWPERELVTVDARAEHYEPTRPVRPQGGGGEHGRSGAGDPYLLDLTDVLGRRHVETTTMGRLAIDEERNAAALELTSRFTVDPRWLIHLPPTMAPVATATDGPQLERPAEAFDYFQRQDSGTVVCQEKHMGSRALAIIGRSPEALEKRFGIAPTNGSEAGIILTRTGRAFFDDSSLNAEATSRLSDALDRSGIWEQLGSDWVMLDGELLPWSAKADRFIRQDFAAVGAAGALWAPAAIDALQAASARGVDGLKDLADSAERRLEAIEAFRAAYRPYVQPTDGLSGVRYAPFTVLAAEGEVLARRSNPWHLEQCDRLVDADPTFMARTDRRVVDLADPDAVQEAADWWERLTTPIAAGGPGGEGMVVKPVEPVARGRRGLILPGVKCRGREYLRLVYGPEYPLEGNLDRLRERGLNRKRSLALREYALGLEALDRFVLGEPLWRVHECVFSILALESEPVDPRL